MYNFFFDFFYKKQASEVAAAAKAEKRKLRAEYDQVLCSVLGRSISELMRVAPLTKAICGTELNQYYSTNACGALLSD